MPSQAANLLQTMYANLGPRLHRLCTETKTYTKTLYKLFTMTLRNHTQLGPSMTSTLLKQSTKSGAPDDDLHSSLSSHFWSVGSQAVTPLEKTFLNPTLKLANHQMCVSNHLQHMIERSTGKLI